MINPAQSLRRITGASSSPLPSFPALCLAQKYRAAVASASATIRGIRNFESAITLNRPKISRVSFVSISWATQAMSAKNTVSVRKYLQIPFRVRNAAKGRKAKNAPRVRYPLSELPMASAMKARVMVAK